MGLNICLFSLRTFWDDCFDMLLRSGAKKETKNKEKQNQRKEANMAGKEVIDLLKSLKDEIKEFRGEFQGFSKDTKQEIRRVTEGCKGVKRNCWRFENANSTSGGMSR